MQITDTKHLSKNDIRTAAHGGGSIMLGESFSSVETENRLKIFNSEKHGRDLENMTGQKKNYIKPGQRLSTNNQSYNRVKLKYIHVLE